MSGYAEDPIPDQLAYLRSLNAARLSEIERLSFKVKILEKCGRQNHQRICELEEQVQGLVKALETVSELVK